MQKGITGEVNQTTTTSTNKQSGETQQKDYSVTGTFKFRSENDYQIFHTLREMQGQGIDEFVTKAVHHYIASILEYPSKLLENPNIKKLHGLTFGDSDDEEMFVLPEPGEERVEIRRGYSAGSTHTRNETFIGIFEGKSAQVLDDAEEAPSFSWEPRTYKGRRVYAFWLSER